MSSPAISTPMQSRPSMSSPAMSTPAKSSVNVQSCNFSQPVVWSICLSLAHLVSGTSSLYDAHRQPIPVSHTHHGAYTRPVFVSALQSEGRYACLPSQFSYFHKTSQKKTRVSVQQFATSLTIIQELNSKLFERQLTP